MLEAECVEILEAYPALAEVEVDRVVVDVDAKTVLTMVHPAPF